MILSGAKKKIAAPRWPRKVLIVLPRNPPIALALLNTNDNLSGVA
ncbi:hypothetical protein FH603_2646 [Spirosoma sp. LMG 31447]|uniref:Uncharacterized protein n=1 Tax=Spirosoma utsteinense TaxID=2585773 RepID=A0ABR6W6B9_9BACT|nr:hypothetical protein [Spirosoma utsteinense]